MKFKGRVWKYGNDINTDVIIPARYMNTSDPERLAEHCMEDLDPEFVANVKPNDIILAGKNFGCGSSREHAPIAIKASGISCVMARSFARIFFRNSINIGLPIVESDAAYDAFSNGDEIEVDTDAGTIVNLSRGISLDMPPLPEFVSDITSAGGLMGYVRRRIG